MQTIELRRLKHFEVPGTKQEHSKYNISHFNSLNRGGNGGLERLGNLPEVHRIAPFSQGNYWKGPTLRSCGHSFVEFGGSGHPAHLGRALPWNPGLT